MLQYLERLYFRFNAKFTRYKRAIGLTYSVAALLTALLVSNLFDALLKDFDFLPMAETVMRYALYGLFLAFVLQFIYLALDVAFGDEPKMPAPPPIETEVRFVARPYRSAAVARASDGVALKKLTNVAESEFAGDTMRPEVVRAAVLDGCALGLQVKDQDGNDVGFFDFYHVRADVLTRWVNGEIFEKDLTTGDFESIDVATRRGDTIIELFVGAIVLKHKNPVYNFYFGPLLATAARNYLSRELAGFDQVRLYASIFSKAGRRYAQVFQFERHIRAKDRGLASGGHDVYFSSFRPADQIDLYYTHSPRNGYLMELKYD